jgi:hypothetical protein
MVVFLPSYKTLEKVKTLWEEKGIMGSIRNKKKVGHSPPDVAVFKFSPSDRYSWSQQRTSTNY